MYDLIVGGFMIIALGTGIVSLFGWITLIIIISIFIIALFMMGSKNYEIKKVGLEILSSPLRLLGAVVGAFFGFIAGFIIALIIQFLFGVNETTNIITGIIILVTTLKGAHTGFVEMFD